jgi:CHAT domain-containing protein
MPVPRHSAALPGAQLAGAVEYGGVTELRVHGVGGRPPEAVLGDLAPEQVSGDAVAGFYRTSDHRASDRDRSLGSDTDRHVEVYSWSGLTSRSGIRVLWLALLPFMLGNLAGWMCSAGTRGSAWRFRVHRQVSGLTALALTVNAVLVAAMVSADVLAYQAPRAGLARHQWWLAPLTWRPVADHPARQVMLGILVPVLLGLALIWLVRRSWRYEAVRPPRAAVRPAASKMVTAAALPGGLADSRFWDGEGSIRLLTWVHATVAGGFLAIVLGITTRALAAGSPHAPAVGWTGIGLGGATVALGIIGIGIGLGGFGRPAAGNMASPGARDDMLRRVAPLLGLPSAAALITTGVFAWLQPGGQAVRSAGLPGMAAVSGWTALGIACLVTLALASTLLGLRGPSRSLAGGSWVTLMLAFSVLNTVTLAAQTSVAHLVGPVTSDAAAARVQGKIYLPSLIISGVPLVVWAAVLAILACGAAEAARWLRTARLPEVAVQQYREQAAAFRDSLTGPRRHWYWSGLPPFAPPGDDVKDQGASRPWERNVARARFLTRAPHDAAWLLWGIVLAELAMAVCVWRFQLQPPVVVRNGGLALAGLALPSLMAFLYSAWRDPARRRAIGVLWDVGTFWPRSYHPLAPPCYAERAVPDLQRRMWWLHDQGGRAVLVAHGQGAMLATAALVQAECRPPDDRPVLITFGSPVGKLYRWGFPAYVDDRLLTQLEPGQAARLEGWRNFYYPTDPVGGPVAPVSGGDRDPVDRELLDPETCCYVYGTPPPAPGGHSGYWADHRVWTEVNRLAAALVVAQGPLVGKALIVPTLERRPRRRRRRLGRHLAALTLAVAVAGLSAAGTVLADVATTLTVVISVGVLVSAWAAYEGTTALRRARSAEKYREPEDVWQPSLTTEDDSLPSLEARLEIRVAPVPPEVRDVAPETRVQRYVVVTGPKAVTAGTEFDISAELLRRLPLDVPAAWPVEVQPTVDVEGRPTGARPVSATLYPSKAFEARSTLKAELPVVPGADPAPAVFTLYCLPGVVGPQELSVVFYQDGRVLGKVAMVITAGAGLVRARPFRRSITVPSMPQENVSRPDVVIRVTRVPFQGRDTLHYSYEWLKKEWPEVEAGSVELAGTADEWLREQLDRLDAAAAQPTPYRAADPGAEPPSRVYERIGENLYRDLFTDELRAFYARFAPETKTLLIFSDEPWIPWELVRPWGDGVNGDSDFLCAQFDMSRWYYSSKSQVPMGLLDVRMVAPVFPPSNLPAARDEARYFSQLPARWPAISLYDPLPVRRREVLDVLAGGRAQVLHFGTHGWLRPQGGGIASITLQDGALKAEDVVGNLIAFGLKRATPLVFMNACHSGRQTTGLVRADGWVERYLELGCRAFLGANWEVNDQLAAQFAAEVYNRLVNGASIARAVREARLVLRGLDPDNPTWLAYSLYAHPNLTVRSAYERTQ